VLIMVLVIVVVLSLAAYSYSELMSQHFKEADSIARWIQAQALADSGIHYTAALLSNGQTFANVLNSMPWNNPQAFQGILVQRHDHPHFRSRFSVISPPGPDEASTSGLSFRYGVTDEAGKINLNATMAADPSGKTLHNRLMALPKMTEDLADSIVDWLDVDNNPRPHGAEDDYYLAQVPPYHCKNGPLDSLEELLMVRGVTPELLFGNDHNRNGVLDPGEGNGFFDQGWSVYLTVYSREQNVDSQFNPRIYVNSPDVKQLYDRLVPAVGADLAYFIAAYRLYGPMPNPAQQQAQAAAASALQGQGAQASGKNGKSDSTRATTTAKQPAKTSTDPGTSGKKSTSASSTASTQPTVATRGQRDDLDFSQKPAKSIASLFELIGTSINIPNKKGAGSHYESPLNDPATLRQLLPLLLDKATTSGSSELPARININTAPVAVLMSLALPDDILQNLLSHRPVPWSSQPPDPVFQTPAWLITEANFRPEIVKQLEKYVTTRSQTYRVQVLGYFDDYKPTARVEAVIDTNGGRPRIVYRRDLAELGKGFNLQQ
jgi:type II secretory pathway component PulK